MIYYDTLRTFYQEVFFGIENIEESSIIENLIRNKASEIFGESLSILLDPDALQTTSFRLESLSQKRSILFHKNCVQFDPLEDQKVLDAHFDPTKVMWGQDFWQSVSWPNERPQTVDECVRQGRPSFRALLYCVRRILLLTFKKIQGTEAELKSEISVLLTNLLELTAI